MSEPASGRSDAGPGPGFGPPPGRHRDLVQSLTSGPVTLLLCRSGGLGSPLRERLVQALEEDRLDVLLWDVSSEPRRDWEQIFQRLDRERTEDRPQMMIFDRIEEALAVDPADAQGLFARLGESLAGRHGARFALFSVREDCAGALRQGLERLPFPPPATLRLYLPSEAAAPLAVSSQPGDNPYVGPRAVKNGELLFGRDREVRELVSMLIADRIVLLSSASGAGKTSLIQARLVQSLEKEDLRVLPLLRVSAAPRPEDRDAAPGANRYVLGTLLSLDPDHRIPIPELLKLGLDGLLRRLDEESRDDRPQVLIFDQFEEILTLDLADVKAKQSFFDQVGEALRDRQRWALFSMREDYIGALEPYVGRLPSRLRTIFRLDLLSPAAARLAICEPARCWGVDFEKAAADLLINDLRTILVQQPDGASAKRSGPHVEPVQLQVVCHRLWNRLPAQANSIDAGRIDPRGGDVDAALADYYADWVRTIAQQDRARERAIRDWFEDALITEQGTRGQVLLNPKESQGLDNEVIEALVRESHLVRAEARRGSTWYELAHDRLIGPVRTSNAAWRERKDLAELERRALAWGRRGLRPESLLLQGQALQEAERWADGRDLTPPEKELLAASRKAQEEAEREQAHRRTADELAWQRSQTRRFRWLTTIALVLALAAVYFYLDARSEAARAREAEDVAELETAKARFNERKAVLAQREQREILREALQRREQSGESAPQAEVVAAQETADEIEQARALRSIPVQLFARTSVESRRAVNLLRDRRFEVQARPGSSTVVNAVWYGTGVDLESVQLVALTLIESGMQIQRIAPINRPSVIQVGTSARAVVQEPLTVEDVRRLVLRPPRARSPEVPPSQPEGTEGTPP